MKAPISWIREYVNIDCDLETLASKLVSIGFEVEEIIDLSKNFSNIVVGQIEKIERHPNAERLSVCQVNIGCKTIQIVTNAKNIAEGNKVPVALDNAKLFDGTIIKDGELRGVKSNGMFCGGAELGANDDIYPNASGDSVLVLADSEIVGEDMIKVLGFDDVILDINVYANRPDCNSIYGLAREFAVALNTQCKPLEIEFNTSNEYKTLDLVSAQVIDNDLCPSYYMQGAVNLNIEKSPLWMSRRLAKMGSHSINNIVDITNYVLYEVGQPMHAFDRNYIENDIIVRRAVENETIVALDEKEYKLDNEVLVIADRNKAIGLAGIMGGANSGISNETVAVMFESAVFKKENIRKSSRRLGLRSDSSARFEKGVEAYTADVALSRALHLIEKLNCGQITSGRLYVGEGINQSKPLKFEYSRVKKILGIDIPQENAIKILNSLGISSNIFEGQLECIIPPYRTDIEKDCDIIEEIIRVFGYDNIHSTLLDNAVVTYGGLNESLKEQFVIKEVLAGQNICEIITYSFSNKSIYSKLLFDDSVVENLIRIINPLGEDYAYLRQTLVGNMLNTIAYNQSKKNKDFALYEFGRCFIPHSLPITEQPQEINKLCISLTGERADFYQMKHIVELIMKQYLVDFSIKRSSAVYLHPGMSADIILSNGEILGSFGIIHPVVHNNFDVSTEVAICEIDFEKLISLSNIKQLRYKPISKYPSVKRDFAFIVNEGVQAGDVLEIAKQTSQLIEEVKLFDVYNGGGLAIQKQKSIAFSVTIVNNERTMNDQEIDAISQKIIEEIQYKFEAKLRM